MLSAVSSNLSQIVGLVFSKHTLMSGVTSSTIMTSGDVVCQSVQSNGSNNQQQQQYDWERTFKFGLIGFTFHGPYTFYCLKALDSQFGAARNLKTAFIKACVTHMTVHPIYVIGVYFYMGLLEGQDFQGCIERVVTNFAPTVAVGTLIWPTCNLISFRFIPFQYRLMYSNIVGVAWNTFLSYQSSQTQQQLPQQSQQQEQQLKQQT